jgi:hypothetical protein
MIKGLNFLPSKVKNYPNKDNNKTITPKRVGVNLITWLLK